MEHLFLESGTNAHDQKSECCATKHGARVLNQVVDHMSKVLKNTFVILATGCVHVRGGGGWEKGRRTGVFLCFRWKA